MHTPASSEDNKRLLANKSGPLHYMGNRNLTWPTRQGRMAIASNLLDDHFSVILANNNGKKFRRCYEPFSGCASWSLAAMELDLADEYIINDSDEVLINTLRLIKDNPTKVKSTYKGLIDEYCRSDSKKDFFLKIIKEHNGLSTLDEKSLLLPFIINHSWGGMIFHDDTKNIVYRDVVVKGKTITQGYLDEPSISLEDFMDEVDRVSRLLNNRNVTFKSGDFAEALSDIQEGDFVAMNPPYPETRRARLANSGLYTELYSEDVLHKKLAENIQKMENNNIGYYMTYGCYDPEMREFIFKDTSDRVRHFLRIVGQEECAFGIGLDQVYFSSQYSIPENLRSKIIPAQHVLRDRALTSAEALVSFKEIAHEKKKHVVFLANIFRIRVDLKRLKTENNHFYLLSTENVLNRMEKTQLAYFSSVHKTSFTEMDLENIVRNLISEKNIDVTEMVIVTNDESAIIPAAKLREKFKIDGARVNTAELFIDKIKMKQRMEQRGVRIPKYVFFNPDEYAKNKSEYINDIFRKLNTEHVFAKPIDSFGSNDVSKLSTRTDLVEWCDEHLTASNYELDEFLVGELFHIDTIVAHGKIVDAQPHRYAYPLAEVLDGRPFAGRLVSPDENDYKELIQFNAEVLNALGPLPNGVTHLEVFKTQNGELVFLEIACRPSAGFTPELSELHCGINFEEAHYLVQMGLPIEGLIPLEQRKMYGAYLFYPKIAGEVLSLSKRPDLKTVDELKYYVKAGDTIKSAQHIMDCVATILMKSEDPALIREEFVTATKLKLATIYPESARKEASLAWAQAEKEKQYKSNELK